MSTGGLGFYNTISLQMLRHSKNTGRFAPNIWAIPRRTTSGTNWAIPREMNIDPALKNQCKNRARVS